MLLKRMLVSLPQQQHGPRCYAEPQEQSPINTNRQVIPVPGSHTICGEMLQQWVLQQPQNRQEQQVQLQMHHPVKATLETGTGTLTLFPHGCCIALGNVSGLQFDVRDSWPVLWVVVPHACQCLQMGIQLVAMSLVLLQLRDPPQQEQTLAPAGHHTHSRHRPHSG